MATCEFGLPFFGGRSRGSACGLFGNAHAVEGAVDKEAGDNEEEGADAGLNTLVFHGHSDFHRQQAEQGREFDDRVHGY